MLLVHECILLLNCGKQNIQLFPQRSTLSNSLFIMVVDVFIKKVDQEMNKMSIFRHGN